MPKTRKRRVSADEIAEKASRGEDISAYFTNKFTVVRPIHRVNVDLTQGMLRELDERAGSAKRQSTSGHQDLAGSGARTESPAHSRATDKSAINPYFFVSDDRDNCFWGNTGDDFVCHSPHHNFKLRNATTLSPKILQVPIPT
jgi:hypothetical protein